ncbi:hypothetical protein G184_gp10 [Erwinia phage ENT90]|uniref:Uncharacterized protein n=1 Tax=Erwinia phage ENT90 TaxID=947843 RepID=F1BUR4_9CAUD|nr:hypothetical protein G184_gp10 [Erwinia phage ENT90]ADX32458.1 hypothetical protein [Erwinia phage ENT90]
MNISGYRNSRSCERSPAACRCIKSGAPPTFPRRRACRTPLIRSGRASCSTKGGAAKPIASKSTCRIRTWQKARCAVTASGGRL